jgi:glutaredoxin
LTAALTVYVRRGCHLCADMTQALQRLQAELGFDVTEVDIDADPELRQRYDTRVPVLVAGATEICYYFLEEDRLRAWLQQPA